MKNSKNKIEELVLKYKDDALRIAYSFRSPVLDPMEKESTAMIELYRAAIKFDENRNVKFTSLLYKYIMNKLSTENKKLSSLLFGYRYPEEYSTKIKKGKRTRLKANYLSLKSENSDKLSNPFGDSLSSVVGREFEVPCESNLEFKEIIILIMKNLSKTQKRVFGMLLNPEPYIKNYRRWGFKKSPTLNEKAIAKICNVSRQRINVHLQAIRRAFKVAIEQQGNPNYKLSEKDKGAIYGKAFK